MLQALACATSNRALLGDPCEWVGCQVVAMDGRPLLLEVSEATSLRVICIDERGPRAERTLVVSSRKKVSLI